VNGRTLSKNEKNAILAKLKEVLANELGGQKEVQGQEPLVTVVSGGGGGCSGCTSCTGRTS
jgi:Fe-S cluster biogenesis protein NfuA